MAYAEIFRYSKRPVLQAKIGMNGGTGNGSLYLPLTLGSGNYKLRAYTNWMKNGGPDCFFEKIITIVNVQKVAALPEKESATTYDVQFFPEGGNLVAGLESKIAFKVTDDKGNGVNAPGTLLITETQQHNLQQAMTGMGSFLLKPVSNHSYKAVIQTNDGKTITKELTSAYTTGMVHACV